MQVIINVKLECSHFLIIFSFKDVWLRFIKFELDHGEASRVGNLHYRAKLTLDPVPVERFLTQYTLHQLQV